MTGSAVLCGGCDTNCYFRTDSPDDGDIAAGDPIKADGVDYDSTAGGIIISGGGITGSSGIYAWVASSEGLSDTVSKVHLTSWTVDGVYRAGLSSEGTGNNAPSRTAVDAEGNAYVATRCLGCQGTVLKIAGDVADCPDTVLPNGIPDTSTGLGDIRGWWSDPDQDECILWLEPVGGNDAIPRSLVVDAIGRIWVGLYNEMRYVVLDPSDGHQLGSVSVNHHPYGAAITPTGILWSTDKDHEEGIQPIDANADPPGTATVGSFVPTPGTTQIYGIAIDELGRVFVADRNGGGLLRFTPNAGDPFFGAGFWDSYDVGWSDKARGMTVMAGGFVFVSHPNQHAVTMHDADTLALLDTFDLSAGGGYEPWGVCPDTAGLIWAANSGSDNVSIIDPAVGVVATLQTQDNNYTYSDFTGYGLMTFLAESGSLYRTYGPPTFCSSGISVRQEVRYTADFPDGGQLVFYGRSADNEPGLTTAIEVPLGSSSTPTAIIEVFNTMTMAGEDPSRAWFQLRVELERGGESPVLQNLTLVEYCVP